MRTCEETKAALVDLVFGELEDEKEIRVHEHLRSCPSCRSEERRLIELRDGVRGRDTVVRAELRERVRAALPRRRSRVIRILGRPVPAYVAVATALAGALLVAAFVRQGSPVAAPVRESAPPAATMGSGEPPSFAFAGAYDTRVTKARSIPDSSTRDSI
jgi:anti-sigma factor RsiW